MRFWIITLLYACLSGCGTRQSAREYPSPNGEVRVVVRQTDKGACCSESYNVEIVLDGKKKEIFSGNGAGKLSVSWSGDDLILIKAKDMYRYEITTRLLRSDPIRSDGSENAIRVKYLAT
jgi:hypothetical protein